MMIKAIYLILPTVIITAIWIRAIYRCEKNANEKVRNLRRRKIKERTMLLIEHDRAKRI